ncbi:MAG: hypothetical protein ACFB2W_00570 [Leptolyngbyaceae cyanobacterium]
MQTLSQKLLFVANSDTTTAIYKDDQIVGSIMFDMTMMRWEYRNHADYDNAQYGDYDELVEAAKQDLDPPFLPARVTNVAADSKPAYLESGSWRTAVSTNSLQLQKHVTTHGCMT